MWWASGGGWWWANQVPSKLGGLFFSCEVRWVAYPTPETMKHCAPEAHRRQVL